MTQVKTVTIYTDGASKGNPGAGGIGVLMIHGDNTKELNQGFNNVTNNQMEMLAVAVALSKLNQSCFVNLYSDSAYVINTFAKGWLKNWKKNGWKTSSGEEVKNQKLWKILDRLNMRHNVTYKHVKGHSGHRENDIVDRLAVNGAASPRRLDFDNYVTELEKSL